MKKNIWIVLIFVIFTKSVFADNRVVNLTVSYKTVNYAGKLTKAIAVNDQIPAPTLHFKEGDHVTINVYNHLERETAIHWHGVLVPWQMDGVLGVSQHGIPPGCVFHYQFTVLQSGTYWYHAHAGLQEQQGLYGAFIIDPIKPSPYQYSKDYVIILSDWSNTDPEKIYANLKKDGEYYEPNFPLQPSLVKFIKDYEKANSDEKKSLIDDYRVMQNMRMSIYDLSDVAYDAFLLNGQTKNNPWTGLVKPGDVVRLRFINAAAASIFNVKIPNTPMKMVHVEGNDIQPYEIKNFQIAPGETDDVLVTIKNNNPSIIYAESRDKVGAAYGALITSPHQTVNYSTIIPFPEPLPVTREMMANMMMTNMSEENSHAMSMPTEPTIVSDKITTVKSHEKIPETMTMGTKYQNITALVETNDPNKPVDKIIKMELFGYMNHYIWFINGLPEYKAKPIILEPGKRYRFIFTNTSMMHHPMHIHGHWFILRDDHGAYDPLLHTLDVPPGATMTTDLDTDASGQWFFHCHLLYHMVSGMSRVFQYSTLLEIIENKAKPENIDKETQYVNRPIVRVDEARPIDVDLVKDPMAHPMEFYFANYFDIGADPFNNVQRLTFKGLYGSDYNKLELFTNDAEMDKGTVENADMDIFYWHLLDQFWAIKGGANYFYRPAKTPYWQPGIGLEGLMPYFIDTDIRSYVYSGSAKFDIELARDTQITNNFLIRLDIRSILATKTVMDAGVGNGLNQMRYIIRPYYRIMPGLNLFAEFESEHDYGSFKDILISEGDKVNQNTLTFGFSFLL